MPEARLRKAASRRAVVYELSKLMAEAASFMR
jgi:hypothetical protein